MNPTANLPNPFQPKGNFNGIYNPRTGYVAVFSEEQQRYNLLNIDAVLVQFDDNAIIDMPMQPNVWWMNWCIGRAKELASLFNGQVRVELLNRYKMPRIALVVEANPNININMAMTEFLMKFANKKYELKFSLSETSDVFINIRDEFKIQGASL